MPAHRTGRWSSVASDLVPEVKTCAQRRCSQGRWSWRRALRIGFSGLSPQGKGSLRFSPCRLTRGVAPLLVGVAGSAEKRQRPFACAQNDGGLVRI